MDLDESIVEFGAKLDKWILGNLATFAADDRAAQGTALLRGFALVKELDRLKADGLAAISALLNRRGPGSEDARAASLVRGFELGAKLADSLSDELQDVDGENKVVRLMNEIAAALDAMACGRTALSVLLDHRHAGVRASAGAYLIASMPERVVPILREIEESEDANSAHFTAHFALLGWKLEGK